MVQTRGQFFPNLSLASSYLKQNTAPIAIASPNMRPSFSSTDVWEHDFTVKQTLFAWGSLYHQHLSARWGRRASEESLRAARQALRARVKRSFYDLLYAQWKVRIAQEAESVSRDHYQTSQARFRQGQNSKLDVSQSKVFSINRQTDLRRSQTAAQDAEAQLRRYLQASSSAPLQIQGDFQAPAAELKIADLEQEMLRQQPEFRALAYQEQQSQSLVSVSRASHRPTLVASFTRMWQSPTLSDSLNRYQYWSALAQVNWPLFDGFSSWGRVTSAQAAVDRLHAQDVSTQDAARQALQQAVQHAQEAKDRQMTQKENVEAAQDNARIINERYRQGLVSYVEFKDAQLSLSEAEANYAQALYDDAVAWVEIERLVGRE